MVWSDDVSDGGLGKLRSKGCGLQHPVSVDEWRVEVEPVDLKAKMPGGQVWTVIRTGLKLLDYPSAGVAPQLGCEHAGFRVPHQQSPKLIISGFRDGVTLRLGHVCHGGHSEVSHKSGDDDIDRRQMKERFACNQIVEVAGRLGIGIDGSVENTKSRQRQRW